MIKKYLLLFILGSTIIGVYAKDKKKIGILPVPAFGYAPETSTYVGAVTLFTFNLYADSVTRVSNADFEFNYTWNKQVILESTWNYYFKEERWFTQGKIHYSKYPDSYYGLGANSTELQKVLFDSNRSIFDINVLKNVGKKVFIGLGLSFQDYNKVALTNSANEYEELTNATTIGPAIRLLNDKRNNILNASSGSYFTASFGYYFSNQNYSKLILDYRKYSTFNKQFIFALRCYNSFTIGTPTFFDYSLAGGDYFARGISYGRYRDKNMGLVQVETRIPVYKDFGFAAFGGASTIYGDYANLNQTIKPNFGIGLRFLIDKAESINLRLDYAIGSDGQSGFYIAFGESF